MRLAHCTTCLEDKERIILDYPSQDLTNLRAQFQHLFRSAPPSSTIRLGDFMNQADVSRLTKHPLRQLSCPCRQIVSPAADQPESVRTVGHWLATPCHPYKSEFYELSFLFQADTAVYPYLTLSSRQPWGSVCSGRFSIMEYKSCP
eukprot:1161215-Pelagomonas_calceolata.AAC.4